MVILYDGDKKLLASEILILWFSAKSCPPCQKIEPFMKSLSNDYPDVVILEIDIEKFPELTEKFTIMNVPTLVFLKNGTEVARLNLIRRREEVEAIIKEYFVKKSKNGSDGVPEWVVF